MTGALLKMSTRSVQTAALAWCRPPKTSTDRGGFFHHRSKVCQVGKNRFRGEGRENGCHNHALSAKKHLELNEGEDQPEYWSCGSLKSQLKRGNSGGASQLALSTASTTMLDQNTVFCYPEKRGTIATWLVAGMRAKSSHDRQLQRKQPFVPEELG